MRPGSAGGGVSGPVGGGRLVSDLLDQHEYRIEPVTAPPGLPARIPSVSIHGMP
jgi:hypothetical protein